MPCGSCSPSPPAPVGGVSSSSFTLPSSSTILTVWISASDSILEVKEVGTSRPSRTSPCEVKDDDPLSRMRMRPPAWPVAAMLYSLSLNSAFNVAAPTDSRANVMV